MTDDTSAKGVSLIATWKDLVAVIRDTLLLVLVVLLVVSPDKINSILIKAGFSQGSIAGFTWTAKLAESDQALKDVRANSTDLKTQNDELLKTLAEVKSNVADSTLKDRLTLLEEKNQKLRAVSDKVEASVKATIASTASLVEQAQITQADGAQWGVVYGGDVDVTSAQQEIGPVAKALNLTNTAIYFRQNSYRSVAVTSDRTEAEQLLQKAKTKRSDAYIVNMNTWCPGQVHKTEYVECGSR